MKCKLYECQKDAVAPHQFCSGTHNYVFLNRQQEKDSWFDADMYTKQLAHYQTTKLDGNKPYRANYTVDELELLMP